MWQTGKKTHLVSLFYMITNSNHVRRQNQFDFWDESVNTTRSGHVTCLNTNEAARLSNWITDLIYFTFVGLNINQRFRQMSLDYYSRRWIDKGSLVYFIWLRKLCLSNSCSTLNNLNPYKYKACRIDKGKFVSNVSTVILLNIINSYILTNLIRLGIATC